MRRVIFILLLFIFITAVDASDWTGDIINASQDVYYYSCANISFSCNGHNLDTIRINYTERDENRTGCGLYILQTRNLSCNMIRISDGTKIYITQSLFDPDNILPYQSIDGSFGSLLNTSMAIWQMSSFEGFDEQIKAAKNYLMHTRDEKYKCWPKTGCSPDLTSRILAYLALSGMNSSERLMFDGIQYLNMYQNYVSSDRLTLIFTAEDDDTECNYTYQKTSKIFTLSEDESIKYEVDAEPLDTMYIDCDDRVNFELRDSDDNLVYSERDDDIYYQIPLGCIYRDQYWTNCDPETTLYYSFLDLGEQRRDKALAYLLASLKNGEVAGKHIRSATPIIDTAHYLLTDPSVGDALTFIKLSQANDGSFEYSFLETSLVRYVLTTVNTTTDYTHDAQKYLLEFAPANRRIINQYPLFFRDVFNAPDYIIFEPKYIEFNGNATFTIYNPAAYDLNITLRSESIIFNRTNFIIPARSNVTINASAPNMSAVPLYTSVDAFSGDSILGRLPVYKKIMTPTKNITTFTVEPTLITLPGSTEITLSNKIDEEITVGLSLDSVFLDEFDIKVEQDKSLDLAQYLPNGSNYAQFTLSDNDTTIQVQVVGTPPDITGNVTGGKNSFSLWPILAAVVLLGSLGGTAYVYKKRQPKSKPAVETNANFEESEILKMITILRSLAQATNQTDDNIRSQLLQQGFSQSEIDEAFNKFS